MRDQLLGHLLRALDDGEHEEVERRLAADAAARTEIDVLRKGLAPLAHDAEPHEPPSGLASRTCDFIFQQNDRGVRATPAADDDVASPMTAPAKPPTLAPLPSQRGGMIRRNWRVIDTIVALGAIAAAALLFFPALVQSSSLAQIEMCQNNLGEVGKALTTFSRSRVEAGFFPTIGRSGNDAVAGMYAVKLRELGYLTDTKHLVCPSSALAASGKPLVVPTAAQLRAASGEELAEFHRTMGGSYGYNLGYVVRGKGNWFYFPAGIGRRQWNPILADAYDPTKSQSNSGNHGGGGQNILFQDGRVCYLSTCRMQDSDNQDEADEDIFRNARREVAAGLGLFDAVLGNSAASPWLGFDSVSTEHETPSSAR